MSGWMKYCEIYGWEVLRIAIVIYYILTFVIQEDLCVEGTWRIWAGSVCAGTLEGDFLVSTTIIDEN